MRTAAAFFFPVLLLAQAPSSTHAPASGPRTSRITATRTSETSREQSVSLTTDDQKTIYALGLSIYRTLAPFNLSPAELKIVEQAMTDAAANKPAIEINVWGPKIQALAEARAAQLAAQQKAAGQAFLAKAATEPGVTQLPSGVLYKEIAPGTGPSPSRTDTVKVNYTGTFIDGKVFDSSNGTPVDLQLDHVIPCWTEGLQHMKIGGKAELVCPSDQAYGERGNRGIPGNSTLIFQVELVAITPGAAPGVPGTPATPPPAH